MVAKGTKVSGCVSVKNSGNSSIRIRKDRRISPLDRRKSLVSLETHALVVMENFLSIIQYDLSVLHRAGRRSIVACCAFDSFSWDFLAASRSFCKRLSAACCFNSSRVVVLLSVVVLSNTRGLFRINSFRSVWDLFDLLTNGAIASD